MTTRIMLNAVAQIVLNLNRRNLTIPRQMILDLLLQVMQLNTVLKTKLFALAVKKTSVKVVRSIRIIWEKFVETLKSIIRNGVSIATFIL